MHGRCFGGPDDEWGFLVTWFGRVPETAILAYEVFGVGDYHPAAPPRGMALEEREQYSRWKYDYHRRLEDDSNAKFAPLGR